jgi:hypothetical protein
MALQHEALSKRRERFRSDLSKAVEDPARASTVLLPNSRGALF